MTLPTDIDATYPDGTEASIKIHQQHHDTIHTAVNEYDTHVHSGDALTPSSEAIAGALSLPGIISASDVGTVNNWNPGGFATCSAIRWTGASDLTLTGILDGGAGRLILLLNTNTTNTVDLILRHLNGGSAAANQLICPGSQDYILGARCHVWLFYDESSGQWRVIAPAWQSNATPLVNGVASAGVAPALSREDHVHPAVLFSADFSAGGDLVVGTGKFRWYNRTGRTLTFDSVSASVGTAPVGSSAIIDIHKNGTTIYSTQANRPTIPAGQNAVDDTTAPNTTTIADNEYLTIDVDQVGSSTPGADLTVQVWMRT